MAVLLFVDRERHIDHFQDALFGQRRYENNGKIFMFSKFFLNDQLELPRCICFLFDEIPFIHCYKSGTVFLYRCIDNL